jgi:alanyl-tRNA synthetase
MQQHTGQHILSQAFVRTAKAATVSFHMGREASTIDLDLDAPDTAALEAAEELACAVVFEDRPVEVLRARPEELASLGARKLSEREGELRVIDVEGFDRSPCGGTHVRRSGEIGLIALVGCERYKGGVRVEFVCGGRALQTLRREHATLREIARLYSASAGDVPRLAAKYLDERSALVREKTRLEEEILDRDARELVASAPLLGGERLVRRRIDPLALDALKVLAQKALAHGAGVVLLGGVAGAAHAVVARGPSAPGDCGAAVKDASSRHGGRGGGRPELAQAGGIPAEALEAWLEAAEAHFRCASAGRTVSR